MNSLSNVSKLTLWPCKFLLVQIFCNIFLRKNTLRAIKDYSQMISESFNLLWQIFFSVLSPYLFTIGLLRYLELGVDASHIPAPYPRNGTRFLKSAFQFYHTRLSLSIVLLSSRLLINWRSCTQIPHLVAFLHWFGLLCWVFDRLYLPNRDCFFLLCLVRCFSSAGSTSLQTASRNWREVAFGNLRFDGCFRLAWAYRRLLRPSSLLKTEPSIIWRE